jgi:hypothetical protein
LLIVSAAAVPYGYAEIKNGKVVETPEVQHAKAAHFAAIAKAGGHANEYSHSGHYGYAEIKNGKVVETPEVQHAKAAHFAAIAKAGGYATGHDSGDSYAHDYSHNEHSDIKYDGKYGYHYPTIKNGVPVDTEAVQHARAAHFAAIAKAPVGEYYEEEHSSYNYAPAYYSEGPVETPEVQHAKAAHFAAHAEANARLHKRSADYYHVPVIHNGVPVDTPEVQLAKAAHAAAHAIAQGHGSYDAGHHDEQHHEQKYDGKYGYHYTVIKNGVPVDTEAVQHARAAHMAKLAGANHGPAEEHTSYDEHHYDHYVPTIHNGVPVETPEVQHAKAAHFAAVAVAKAHSGPAKHDDWW